MSLVRKTGFVVSLALAALVFMLSGLTPTASNQSQKPADEEAATREIMAVLKAHKESWNSHDMDKWADALLHDDSDWVNWRGGYWHGKAAIKAGHQAIHKSYYRNSNVSDQRVEDLIFLAPNTALVHARSSLSGDERAPGQSFQYRKTILFTKQKGVWRIRALHNTRLMDADQP